MPSTADQISSRQASSLLNILTDEELARYGEVARDQAAREFVGWRLVAGLSAGVAAAAILAFRTIGEGTETAEGETLLSGRNLPLLAAALTGLIYLPYRRVKNWTLWNRHCAAVLVEQQRRLRGVGTGVRVDVAR